LEEYLQFPLNFFFLLLRKTGSIKSQMIKELLSHSQDVLHMVGVGAGKAEQDRRQNLLRRTSHFHQFLWKITYGLNIYSKEQICF
jgi:hypothetical protein